MGIRPVVALSAVGQPGIHVLDPERCSRAGIVVDCIDVCKCFLVAADPVCIEV